jgi:formyl-CoA transferase
MTPLDGLLVADFSRVLAGPLATMTLADLGATVVKVERPGVGDETRTWGPPWTSRSSAGGSGTSSAGEPSASAPGTGAPGTGAPGTGASSVGGSSAYFDCVNRSKLGITLDLADAVDRAAAHELARRADVVIHNLRGMDRFGLDYASVSAGNPDVVYCSITGFGADSDRGGYDFLVQAVGGLMSITGDRGGEPRKVGVALVDVLTGKDAVIGILAALHARSRTGRGEHVQVELLSSLLGGLVNQAAGYLVTGAAPGPMGNEHPSIAPYETLHCADGLLAVACGNDAQFARLVDVLGMPELAADPRFATNPTRVGNRPALVSLLEAALGEDTAAAWEGRLTDAGVPAGLVGDIGEALQRADECGLAPLVDVAGARQVRHPVRYANATSAAPTAPPALGEHDAVIRAWLADREAAPLPPT